MVKIESGYCVYFHITTFIVRHYMESKPKMTEEDFKRNDLLNEIFDSYKDYCDYIESQSNCEAHNDNG